MVVGILLIHLYLPDSTSLKAKRQIIHSIKTRLKNKFNISIAEISLLDCKNEAEIGISCISNKGRYIDKQLSYIVENINSHSKIEILNYSIEKI